MSFWICFEVTSFPLMTKFHQLKATCSVKAGRFCCKLIYVALFASKAPWFNYVNRRFYVRELAKSLSIAALTTATFRSLTSVTSLASLGSLAFRSPTTKSTTSTSVNQPLEQL